MKRIICIAIVIMLAIQISGCASKDTDEIPEAANFYYVTEETEYHSKDGFISSEKKDVENEIDDLTSLVNLYLTGPKEAHLKSPFPQNTVVRNITHKNSIFSITLSNEFSQLTGFDLSVACACLTLTIQEFADANLVQISAENAELDGNKSITMSTDSLVLFDQVMTEG